MRRIPLVLLTLGLTSGLAACQSEAGQTAGDATAPDSPAASADPVTAVPESRTFRDWTVTCGNNGDCTAYGSVADDNGWLRLFMPAGPGAEPVVHVGMWMSDGSVVPTLTIDGQPFASRIEDDLARIPADRTRAVIDALAEGRAAELGTADGSLAVSVSGISAALLWIDERQGRLGTVTALIRKGDAPASTVPAAPTLPVVAAAPAVAQTGLTATQLPDAVEDLDPVRTCRTDTDFNPDFQYDIQQYRLAADTVLWGVPCFMGAYNTGYLYVLTDNAGASPRIVSLPTTGEAMETPINPEYDPATRRLEAFGKGRGLGDCGTVHQWIWTGRAFVLEHERRMEACMGVTADLWPVTWNTRPAT
ncbi:MULTISPECIES: DUF1176 domain-containing protein [unclassified Brevundimonas]|jgi:hypothetical protein|uniref:DUF1176 domain-containing protein n=1 Tax=unclassified Brevundimonas TaxID=2622653 RepID=UPI000C3A315A|nr:MULTISPECIES: DUF1176 domain-containing protein [unclassified Brevundimonas]MAL89107.1 hypothetical protein [Brevundimonas sp.]HAV49109.1 hypothetical protein [Brevundimonas sp.]|tara:strand:- start:14155 stop:15240 length:1086 start_codon:yes stop_codon:yes gene_type:complete